MHYLYKITNTVNGKIYIGQTIQPEKRWNQHLQNSVNPTMAIGHAIKKYGIHNFKFIVIAQCKTIDDANYLETLLVEQYDSFIGNGKGYNATNGGMNAPKSEAWKQYMSQHMKEIGHKPGSNAEYLDTIRGVPLTDEQKEKSKSMLGKNHSEETKVKQTLNNVINGLGHGNKKGKFRNQTDEHKSNRSKALKDKSTGRSPGNAKFTLYQANLIREEYKSGLSSIKLALKYNVSKRTILNIVNNKVYK